MAIGILLSEHLWTSDALRQRPTGFLTAVRKKFIRTPFASHGGIRGQAVAASSLIDAIISVGNDDQCELFAYPATLSIASQRLSKYQRIANKPHKVSLNSTADILKSGMAKFHITSWLDPLPSASANSGVELSQRIRRSHSDMVYPVTMLAHGLSGHWMLSSFFLRLILENTQPCDSVICTSNASRQAAQKIFEYVGEQFSSQYRANVKYNGRIDVIPLCVDTGELKPRDRMEARAKVRLPKEAFIMLFLGRLSVLKADLYPFFTVLESLIRANPERKLLWVVAGTEDQHYTDRLLAYANSVGLSTNIRVIVNPTDDLRGWLMAAADVFVSPSDSVQESFGLTPIEAMACGLPQVVPAWDGYRDTIKHGETGFLVPTYWADCQDDLTSSGVVAGWMYDHLCLGQSIAIDLNKTREYLQCLISNDELRLEMSRRSRERALTLYAYEAVVKQYEALWKELRTIAACAQLQRDSIAFDEPRYHDFFGHYACTTLSDSTELLVTPAGEEMVSHPRYPPREISPLLLDKIIDKQTLHRILRCLLQEEQSGSPEDPKIPLVQSRAIRMGDLVRLLAVNLNGEGACIRRHILWLVKYGYVQPVL